jgi:hypothetical protein
MVGGEKKLREHSIKHYVWLINIFSSFPLHERPGSTKPM